MSQGVNWLALHQLAQHSLPSLQRQWLSARPERCGVTLRVCQNRDGHGTKLSQELEGVSQQQLIFLHFIGNVSCSGVPRQRDHVHHLIARSAGDESLYVASSVVGKAFSCVETSGAFCNSTPGPAAIATPPGLASQADRRASNGCPKTILQFCSLMTSRAQTCPASVRRVSCPQT